MHDGAHVALAHASGDVPELPGQSKRLRSKCTSQGIEFWLFLETQYDSVMSLYWWSKCPFDLMVLTKVLPNLSRVPGIPCAVNLAKDVRSLQVSSSRREGGRSSIVQRPKASVREPRVMNRWISTDGARTEMGTAADTIKLQRQLTAS